MKKGDEPLRSFGDLLQFYSKEEQSPDPSTPPESSAVETNQSNTGDPATALPTPESTSDAPPSEPAETQSQQPTTPEPEQNPADDVVTESPSSDRTSS